MNTNKTEYKKAQEEFLESVVQPLLEMATLDGDIVVRNDGAETKFAHFHWKGVHFRFQRNLPKNSTELKNMIAFESEKNYLKPDDYKYLLSLLAKKPVKGNRRGNYKTVYDLAQDQWELLNERTLDYID